MTRLPTPIRAIAIEPWVDEPAAALPPLDLELASTGITCLIGDDNQRLERYLRALGGVDDLSGGQLYLFDHPFRGMSLQQWRQLRLKLGFVTRTAPLLSVLNGLQNVILPVLYHKMMSRDEAQSVARRYLEMLRCDADLTLLPAYMSPLERTQLAIARAALLDPAVLLLEEPYHELEIDEHEQINAFLVEWAKAHALVISTQNLRFVKRHADRIVFAGEDKVLYFESWNSFMESTDKRVRSYLEHYRRSYYLDSE